MLPRSTISQTEIAKNLSTLFNVTGMHNKTARPVCFKHGSNKFAVPASNFRAQVTSSSEIIAATHQRNENTSQKR